MLTQLEFCSFVSSWHLYLGWSDLVGPRSKIILSFHPLVGFSHRANSNVQQSECLISTWIVPWSSLCSRGHRAQMLEVELGRQGQGCPGGRRQFLWGDGMVEDKGRRHNTGLWSLSICVSCLSYMLEMCVESTFVFILSLFFLLSENMPTSTLKTVETLSLNTLQGQNLDIIYWLQLCIQQQLHAGDGTWNTNN